MQRAVETFLKLLPLIFAFGFLLPVFNQGFIALGLQPPLGLSTLTCALIVAGVWGLIAQFTGRWI